MSKRKIRYCKSCDGPIEIGNQKSSYLKCISIMMNKVCKECNTHFLAKLPRQIFCSSSCSNRVNAQKTKLILIEKYGVENPSQSREFSEKAQAANRANHGGKMSFNAPQQQQQTMLERYGVMVPYKNESIKLKGMETVRKKYETGNVFQNEDANAKIAFELDGWYWHKDSFEKDKSATLTLLDQGYRVARVRMHSPNGLLGELSISHNSYLELTLNQDSIENKDDNFTKAVVLIRRSLGLITEEVAN